VNQLMEYSQIMKAKKPSLLQFIQAMERTYQSILQKEEDDADVDDKRSKEAQHLWENIHVLKLLLYANNTLE